MSGRGFKALLQSKRAKEFVRFCIVGGLSTGIHYVLYLILLKIFGVSSEIGINVCYSAGYIAGFVFNLFMTACFTFKTNVTFLRSLGFVVTNLINYGLHIVFLNLFIGLSVPTQWAPIPTFCCVIPINFILVRTVFRRLK